MSTMRGIVVESWDQPPHFANLPKPTESPEDTHVHIKVIAAGLSGLIRSQAAGRHYSSKNAGLPYIPGSDGLGVTASGEFLYFSSMATGGAFAEYVNVPKAATVKVPFADSLSHDEKVKEAIRIAGIVNPAMASWLALKTRTTNLKPNFTVIINGVTSLSGKIAISHARALGAGKVIGVGRNEAVMKTLGLDQYIVTADPADKTDFKGQLEGQQIDVILDFVYGGGSTAALFDALPSDAMRAHEMETQFVQIGSVGGLDINLPGATLRSKNITIRGSGPGSWSVTKDFREQFPGLMQRLVEGVGEFEVVQRSLEDIDQAWADWKTRSVFVM